ncbi:MAG: penicillin-binding protein 2 [Betaproteobacteria bacterium]|jgi:cell division protein FtsI (penicillin-binding protein 3)|nr:penicillin-binding protein 2 [Betaproteobacteria bacterium]
MAGFCIVIVRAFTLQLVNADQWQTRAEKRFERPREIPANRGRVLDRHGEVIASSVQEEQLGIVPTRFVGNLAPTGDKKVDAQRAAKKKLEDQKLDELAAILEMKPSEVRTKIYGAKKFFWLARGLNLEQADRIRGLRLEGVELENDFRRYYPYGEAFAHIVGFTNAHEQGAEGLEATHDQALRGTSGQLRVVIDRRGSAVEGRTIADALHGKDLQLSLDASIQSMVYSTLKSAVAEHRAKAAAAVVIDAQTGEVLALVNEPSFDPNNRTKLNPDRVRNRAVTDTFEPGSTMKSFSIAAALELGRVGPKTEIQTAPGKITIGNRTIGDSHPHGTLTVEEVLAKSSNVGTVRITQRLQAKELYDLYVAAGFGRVPDVGLNGATAGRLRQPEKWVPIDQATISYGHGVSVSLLQLARAYTVFARDGDLVPISFVPQPGPVAGVPVISPETARAVRKMLEMATTQGTAPKAQIAGFRVAGKTGTAHKPERGGYAKNKYVASFVGFAPADQPRFVIAVMVDEPSAGKHYGGEVAAPIFSQIANDALRRMQMSPNPALRILPAVALIGEGTE